LIDAPPSDHGVLSHPPGEHLQNLRHAHPPPLDQAKDHAEVLDYRPRPRPRWLSRRRRLGRRGRGGTFAALGVEFALLVLTLFVLVVGRAAAIGLTFATGFPASEGTTQIAAPRIARMREKENPAVPTARPAPAQLRPGSKNRPEQHVIREDQSDDRTAPIPIRGEPKMLPDLDC